MSLDVVQERQQAHAYLDRLPPAQLSAVRSLLETMLPDTVSRALANAPLEDEEISEEENQAVARSKEWFKNNQGTSFEDVVAELGLSMDEIRNAKEPA
jgi:predicted transcriptional regulator